jgi:hypothetical protein
MDWREKALKQMQGLLDRALRLMARARGHRAIKSKGTGLWSLSGVGKDLTEKRLKKELEKIPVLPIHDKFNDRLYEEFKDDMERM